MRGVVAFFRELDATVDAVEVLKKRPLGDFTVYTATPRHEIEHAADRGPSAVRRFALVGGKAIATWVPYTVFGFEVMVLIGALATVAGLFANARIPRITTTVGYDTRFSHGDYGIWIEPAPDKMQEAEQVLRDAGAVEVRVER